ncbi:MAG: hypothetical protein AB7G25_09145 [Sphingomonadaceae bacterium]
MMQQLHTAPVDLGSGFSVEFHFDGERLGVRWTPAVPGPTRTNLIAPNLRARDSFLADVARVNGINVAVVNV